MKRTRIDLILAIKGNPLCLATAQVLSTLLNIKHQFLNPEILQQELPLPHHSVLILTENQIFRNLAQLRQRGFPGAVLILSDKSPEKVKETYPILRYGVSSHAILPLFNSLSTLIEQLIKLIPMGEDNLNDLQERLKASVKQLDQEIMPLLETIAKDNNNLDHNLDLIEKYFLNLLQYTPDFSHEKFISQDSNSPPIRTKFSNTIETIRTSPDRKTKHLAVLHEICQRWRNHVLITGEGLGRLPHST